MVNRIDPASAMGGTRDGGQCPHASLSCCVEPDSLPSSSEPLSRVGSQLCNFLQAEPLCCVESQTQSLSSD